MELNNLPKTAELKARKRVGRGPGSGMGKTSTRGENGQKSRSGASIKPWFQGGQSPLYRRLPKRGFKNHFRTEYAVVNLDVLEKFEAGAVVDYDVLFINGYVKEVKNAAGLKVLGTGTLTKALTVKASKFSATAKTAIENAGGTCEEI